MSEPLTKPIRDLVADVLKRRTQVPDEHIIDDVLFDIEHDPLLRAEYDGLCETFGTTVVNQMIGRWTKGILGWSTIAEVDARKNSISKNYSTLMPSTRKLTKEERLVEAADSVFAFFRAFREVLDRESLKEHKGELQQMVVDGAPVEDAFLTVMSTRGIDTGPLLKALNR
jgi:hypothetical protein